MENYSVVLPAAGKGTRLRSNKPKLMSRFVDDEFLWEKQINVINKVLDNPPITYILGFENDKIAKKLSKYANIIINENFETTNVAYGTMMGLGKTDNILIIYGDLFFNETTLEQIKNSGENSFVITNRTTMEDDEIGCLSLTEKVNHFDYGFDIRWGQITYLKQDEQRSFSQKANEKPNRLGFEILNSMVDEGTKFDVIEPKNGIIFDIDSYKDLNKVNTILEGK